MLPTPAAETVDAVWQGQVVDFTFVSLEMAYSCDLMEARIKMLLHHVAATDVQVTVPSCGGFKRPERQFRILARCQTLVPAGNGDVDVIKGTGAR